MHLISYDVTYLFMIMWEGVRKGVNLEMENCCKNYYSNLYMAFNYNISTLF